jgi:glycosyltransferase involved in cell wall biosynthesis
LHGNISDKSAYSWSEVAVVCSLSVIIPALNEEAFLGETLKKLNEAIQWQRQQGCQHGPVQVIVVDNDSQDRTAAIARGLGATVVHEPIRNIARARNSGARFAKGDVLFFLDADTLIPPCLLSRIAAVMSDPSCEGGAVDVDQRPSRPVIRLYMRVYCLLGRLTAMAGGAAQFCRRQTFLALGGYDESIYMGEDVDFYWRLRRIARRARRKVCYIADMCVVSSPRRFDRWPLWRTLLWTNPALVALFRRRKRAWHGWYEDIPR